MDLISLMGIALVTVISLMIEELYTQTERSKTAILILDAQIDDNGNRYNAILSEDVQWRIVYAECLADILTQTPDLMEREFLRQVNESISCSMMRTAEKSRAAETISDLHLERTPGTPHKISGGFSWASAQLNMMR